MRNDPSAGLSQAGGGSCAREFVLQRISSAALDCRNELAVPASLEPNKDFHGLGG